MTKSVPSPSEAGFRVYFVILWSCHLNNKPSDKWRNKLELSWAKLSQIVAVVNWANKLGDKSLMINGISILL